MSKNIIIGVIALALIAGGIYYFGYQQQDTPSPAPAPTTAKPNTAPSNQSTNSVVPSIVPKDYGPTLLVSIKGFAFVSEVEKVKAGTKVIWKNFDAAWHTVSSDSGLFASRVLKQGESFEYVFTKSGTYNYSCSLHANMKGQIIVE